MADNWDQFPLANQSESQGNNDPWAQFPLANQTKPGNPNDTSADTSWENWGKRAGYSALEGVAGFPQAISHLTGIGKQTMDEDVAALHQKYLDARKASGLGEKDIDWAGTLGSIAPYVATAPFSPELGVAKLGMGSLGTGLAKGAIQGATAGLGQGIPNTENYGSQLATNVGLGAGVGAAAPLAAKAIGNVISPVLSKSAQMMKEAGVRVPVNPLGKTMGEYAKDYPLAGLVPQQASETALQDFEKATANKVLQPIGESIPKDHPVGPELIDTTRDKIGNMYDSVHPNIQLGMDNQLGTELQNIQQRAIASGLPSSQLDSLDRIISNQIGGKLSNGADGPTIQSMTSELGRSINGYMRDPSFDNRNLGNFLGDAREALTDAINRQNAPELTQNLRNANKSYSLYKTMEKAASSAGIGPGRFNPSMLYRAGNQGQTAFRKATGTGNLQDWASAGMEQLGNKVPNSGTPQRLLGQIAYHGAVGIGGHGAAGALMPSLIVPGVGIAGTYSQPGQFLLRQLVRNRPWNPQIGQIAQRYLSQTASPIASLATGSQD